jgi:hypothetical protein
VILRKTRPLEYGVWAAMCRRCEAQHPAHRAYYDRGIRVCEEWLGRGGFQRFIEHIGWRPTSDLTLDRIDNDRGYEPGNVRWASRVVQANNTRWNLVLEYQGRRNTLAEWSRAVGLSSHLINGRLRNGWTVEAALETPSQTVAPEIESAVTDLLRAGVALKSIATQCGVSWPTITRIRKAANLPVPRRTWVKHRGLNPVP